MGVTTLYFFVFSILGLVTSSLGPTLPGLAGQTGDRLSEISVLFLVRAFGYLLGSFLGGRLYDRFTGHRLMGSALLCIAIAMFLVPFVPVLWVLSLVFLAVGVGEGLLDVGGNTLIVWRHGARVAPFMNGLHFFFGLGAFLSPILVARMMLWNGGISGVYWLIAALILPAALMVFGFPSPPAPRAEAGPGAGSLPNAAMLWAIVVFMMLYVGAEVGFGSWIYSYGLSQALGEVNAAYLNSVFWGAFTLSRLLSIPASARIRSRHILIGSFLGALASLGVILLWQAPSALLWLASFGVGFSIAPVFPTMLTFAGKRMAITGRVTGYFFLGATAGGMFLPWFIGQFFETAGPRFFVYTLVVDMILTCLVFGTISFLAAAQNKQTGLPLPIE